MQVIAWPRQVGAVAAEWSYAQGVSRSRSLLTGRSFLSQSGPERRVASISVSGYQNGGVGAGYMEVLKRHLRGGAAAVRLWSQPINQHLRQLPVPSGGGVLTWVAEELPLDWTTPGDAPLTWMSAGSFTGGKPSGTVYSLEVYGLPPHATVAAPGDFIAVTSDTTGEKATLMVGRECRSNATGLAQIVCFEPVPFGGIVQFGVRDSAVFLADNLPRAVQPVSGDWRYDWSFEEVFADEVGGFEEIDPW